MDSKNNFRMKWISDYRVCKSRDVTLRHIVTAEVTSRDGADGLIVYIVKCYTALI